MSNPTKSTSTTLRQEYHTTLRQEYNWTCVLDG